MMAAHATCTMNGSPSATWPTASTTAADAGAADTICAATLAAAALSATYAFKRDVALSSVSRTHRARHGASHAPFPSIPNLGATAIEAPRLASRRRAVPYPPPRRVPPRPRPTPARPTPRAAESNARAFPPPIDRARSSSSPSRASPRRRLVPRAPIATRSRARVAPSSPPPIASIPRPPSRAPASARSKSSPSRARASSPPSTSRAPPRVRARAAPRSRRGRARRPRRGRTFCSVSTRFALGAAAHRTVRWFFVARALEARAVTVGRAVAACIGASCAARARRSDRAPMRARAPSFYTTFFPPFIQFKEI